VDLCIFHAYYSLSCGMYRLTSVNSEYVQSLLLWETQTETQDSEARKQCFIVTAQTQQTHVQKLSPENKGDSLYIPLQASYRGKEKKKKQHNVQPICGYMQFCRYFTLVLSALLPLLLHDLLHVWIL
jgi:hypothetical protein